jgi:hypothetical protein
MASWDIIFFICPNCFTSWFTACTVVPDPMAMRFLREPSISSGRARSAGVIERMIASSRSSSDSSMSAWRSCFEALPIPGIIPSTFESGPMRRTWRIWVRKSSSVNCCFRILRSSSAAWSRSDTSSAFSISDSTSPMPRIRLAIRSGWKRSSCSSFSPVDA